MRRARRRRHPVRAPGRHAPSPGGRAPQRREPSARADRDPARILELLLGVIGRLADARPLLLVFEDVQWADPATLDLVALLVAGTTARQLMVVFTVRSDELHRAHPFRRISARWEQQRTIERLPLFVEELLGAMRDGGLNHDYLPPSLRDVLLARSERLSPSAQHVLRVASAGGRWVPERLLSLAGEAGGDRAGSTELDDPGLDATSMLAHHWLAAHDLPRALTASVLAGRAAAEAYAPSAAQRHFELALELWTQVPDAQQRAGIPHPELLDAAADATYRAGAVDRALALTDQALEEVGGDGPGIVVGSLVAAPLVSLLGVTGAFSVTGVTVLVAAGLLTRRPLLLAASPVAV